MQRPFTRHRIHITETDGQTWYASADDASHLAHTFMKGVPSPWPQSFWNGAETVTRPDGVRVRLICSGVGA
jgi:hypothetical protein